jgi:holo-[acyl-carrier protein] synthase
MVKGASSDPIVRRYPQNSNHDSLKETTAVETMEILGIGTDIVECLRIGRMIERHGELFLLRVYTTREIRYCQGRKHSTEHFAGRWAAKEAILKSLGAGWRRGMCWTDVEVRNDGGGKPEVHLCGAVKDRAQQMHLSDILLTISHCRAYATASAIAVSGTVPRRTED